MASKKKIMVEVDIGALKKLVEAAAALSELANAWQTGSEDPAARATLKKAAKKRTK